MPNVVSTLTERQQKELAEEAVKAAKNLGYCSQTGAVLREMGFNVDQKAKITYTFEVDDLPIGFDIDDAQFYVQIEDGSGDYLFDSYISSGEVKVKYL